jgi:hypothetical protein
MLSLPADALGYICSFLDLRSLSRLSRTCRRWKSAVKALSKLGSDAKVLDALARSSDQRELRAFKRKITQVQFERRKLRVSLAREALVERLAPARLPSDGWEAPCRTAGCTRDASAICGNCHHNTACESHARMWVCDCCLRLSGCDRCRGAELAPVTNDRCEGCGAYVCSKCRKDSHCSYCHTDLVRWWDDE